MYVLLQLKKKKKQMLNWQFCYLASHLQICRCQSQKDISHCIVVTLVQLPQLICFIWMSVRVTEMN